MDIRRLEVKITGRVQGVYFRAATQDFALKLGLVGWVRNSADGGVELEAEGPRARLEQLLGFCQRGPSAARVDFVDLHWREPRGDLGNTFVILP